MNKKSLLLLIVTFFISIRAYSFDDRDAMLLGDWYWFNLQWQPSQNQPYKGVSLHFLDNNQFHVYLLGADDREEHGEGVYELTENKLFLSDSNGNMQAYPYEISNNELVLEGTTFVKLPPQYLAGSWYSTEFFGDDIDKNVQQIFLTLQPNYAFSLSVSGTENGQFKRVDHDGIYYLDGDYLILVYEDGVQESKMLLDADTLTLTNDQFGMGMVLKRLGSQSVLLSERMEEQKN
ncbi:MAG: lipocalin family protein [Vibrionaceae bacterium]